MRKNNFLPNNIIYFMEVRIQIFPYHKSMSFKEKKKIPEYKFNFKIKSSFE